MWVRFLLGLPKFQREESLWGTLFIGNIFFGAHETQKKYSFSFLLRKRRFLLLSQKWERGGIFSCRLVKKQNKFGIFRFVFASQAKVLLAGAKSGGGQVFWLCQKLGNYAENLEFRLRMVELLVLHSNSFFQEIVCCAC